MKNIEDCLGEKVSQILIKPEIVFISADNEIIAEEILVLLEKSKLRILPIQDTDEISVECLEIDNTENDSDFLSVTLLDEYIGEMLSESWKCVNSRGYFDLFILGFYFLHPSLMILSEGSTLKLFKPTQLRKETKDA